MFITEPNFCAMVSLCESEEQLMSWTQPKTWSSEPLTSSDLNTHLRDNLEALKDPPGDNYILNQGSDYSTTSTSWVDVDSTNLSFTLTTNGGDLMVHIHLPVTGTGIAFFDLDLDGSRVGGDDGIARNAAGGISIVSFTRLISGLAAGTHTVKLQWRMASGTGTIYAGAGTSNADFHAQMWVREIS
jgi:hypothetical protein